MPKPKTQPQAIIGAEQLTASFYRRSDGHYRFNIVRLNKRTGQVCQWYRPTDLLALLKLMRMIAAEVAQDDDLDSSSRDELEQLTTELDHAVNALNHHD